MGGMVLRTKSSVYNMIVRLFSSIIPSVLGLILNNLMLSKFGSDVNGVVATIAQVLSFLTLFEGGFTLASNIALYRPYLDNDSLYMNSVLSASRSIYIKIGYIILSLTLIVSFFVPYIIISDLEKRLISTLFIISSINLLVNFFFYYKYTIMFSVSQQEYKIGLLSVGFTIISQCAAIGALNIGADIVGIRLILVVVPLFSIPFVTYQHKRSFPYINFHSEKPDYSLLKSSKDVFVQKIASLIYSSTDMVLLSIFVNTLTTSVYAVYNMIFMFVKSLLFSVILAPFNAFGQLYAEDNNSDVLCENYKVYSHISFIIISIFLTSVILVILPFIALYTTRVQDTTYVDQVIAFLFFACVFLELLSNMTGGLLNSAGRFKEMKNNVLIGSIINATVSLLLVKPFGIKGVLFGTILAYLIMDVMQIQLVYSSIIKKGYLHFIVLLIFNVLVSIIIILVGTTIRMEYNSYMDFLINGLITFVLVSTIIIAANWIAYRKEYKAIVAILCRVLKRNST